MYGFTRKQLSLVILVVQNTMLVIMMRYSRTKSSNHDEQFYIPSTAVVMAEVMKLMLCLVALRREQSTQLRRTILHHVFHNPRELLAMAVPAGLYALQNNWLYVALSNLEAATFQITYQLKILSTALFSVFLLHRTIDRHQWLALLLLMIGVSLVQLQSSSSEVKEQEQQQHKENPLLGLITVLASCVSSGFAGCYFEKLLKSSNTSMWVRNIQLGVFALLFSVVAMVANDSSRIREGGLFQGYNWLTWLVIANQALGGLVVATVVKYADNISKAFATSVSIILSTSISFCFFQFQPSSSFVVGAILVICATVLYGRAPRQKSI